MSNLDIYTPSATYALVRIIGKHPKIGVTLGFLCIIIFSTLLIFNWNEYEKFNKPSVEMTVAEASEKLNLGEQQLITLTDAVANCNKHITSKSDNFSEIPFSNYKNTILVIGKYSDKVECTSISGPLKGVGNSYQGDAKFVEILKSRIDFGLNEYKNNNKVLGICTYCGPENSKTGIIVCLALATCGLILIVLSPILHKKYQEQLAVDNMNKKGS